MTSISAHLVRAGAQLQAYAQGETGADTAFFEGLSDVFARAAHNPDAMPVILHLIEQSAALSPKGAFLSLLELADHNADNGPAIKAAMKNIVTPDLLERSLHEDAFQAAGSHVYAWVMDCLDFAPEHLQNNDAQILLAYTDLLLDMGNFADIAPKTQKDVMAFCQHVAEGRGYTPIQVLSAKLYLTQQTAMLEESLRAYSAKDHQHFYFTDQDKIPAPLRATIRAQLLAQAQDDISRLNIVCAYPHDAHLVRDVTLKAFENLSVQDPDNALPYFKALSVEPTDDPHYQGYKCAPLAAQLSAVFAPQLERLSPKDAMDAAIFMSDTGLNTMLGRPEHVLAETVRCQALQRMVMGHISRFMARHNPALDTNHPAYKVRVVAPKAP